MQQIPAVRFSILCVLTAAVLCVTTVGCTSERERTLRRHREMHETLRSAPAQAPGKWELETKE